MSRLPVALFLAAGLGLAPGAFADGFSLPFLGGGSSGSGGGGTTLNLNTLFNAAKAAKDAFTDVSPKEEEAIGGEAAAVLLGAVKPVDDPRLQRYVNRVGRWVALHTERPDLDWRFAVLDTDTINSFAAPGGYVFITKGLLLKMHNEAELAGVLGHECTHVVRKHYLKALKKGARAELVADLASAAGKEQKREQLEKIAGGFKEIYSRGLDKEDEFEADRMGVVVAARAGYDPWGLPAVLQTLQAMNPEDGSLAYMFESHPSPSDRLARLDAALSGLKLGDGAGLRKRFMAETRSLRRKK